ncbi:hypothetical protein ACW9H6_25455 [Pseudomonas sp. SDO528_S397]
MEISSKRSSTALPSSFSEAAPRNVKPQRSATLPVLTPDALKKELQALTVKMERTGALTTELHTLLHRRWLYERTLSSDFNDITFGETRRNKLAEFDGGALVAGQYGMNCAEDENLDYSFLHKLHIGGEFNSFYQRQWASEKFNAQCTKLYTDQGGEADDNVLYFNSPSSAQRFLNHCAADLLEGSAQQHLETQGKLLYPGIYAVKFKAPAKDGLK